jgi:hypothetical protein
MAEDKIIKHLIVYGVPKVDLAELLPHLDEDEGYTYIDQLCDLVPEGGYSGEDDGIVNTLLYHFKGGTPIYVCKPPSREDKRIFDKVMLLRTDLIWDEALEGLDLQVTAQTCENPDAFIEAYFDACEKATTIGRPIEFASEDNQVIFWPKGRTAQQHTITWCADGTMELDGLVMRRTAIMGVGHVKSAMLGNQVLEAQQVVSFIAARLVTNGVEDLVGYGRAFGPGKKDQTNATLTPKGRKFRALGVVGVVAATETVVMKARPEMVEVVCLELRRRFPDQFILPHQQMREIYFGDEALEAFRGKREDDGKFTLFGKSSKHTRVDAGAFCLYTDDEGYITLPALIGSFECGNDGSIYMPKALMDTIGGWLHETVGAVRDFQDMSPELRSRYYNADILVKTGDVIEPGQVLFTMDGLEHRWDTKADWGVVTDVVDEMTSKLVRVNIAVDAHFEGDIKMRGFGKGLCCPSEAAGITGMNGKERIDRVLIGAPGIIKDAAAAAEYISDAERVVGTCVTHYNPRDFELAKQKHQPQPVPDSHLLVKHYPETGVMMYFNERKLRVVEVDPNAIACNIKCMIEAAPVAQGVGTSAMTMPQMSWLSSLPAGNQWLKQHALAGVIKRVQALAYLHTVKNRIPMAATK